MTEQTSAEKAVEIITREMPGFKSKIDAGRDRIIVRGCIHFNATAALDVMRDIEYAVPDSDAGVEQFAALMIEVTRQNGIAALGLDKIVQLQLQRARHEASVAAFADGKKAGIVEGRREMLAEVIAATDDGVYEGPRNV